MSVRHSLVRLLAVTNRNSLDARRAVELFSQEHWGLHRFRLQQFIGGMDRKKPMMDALGKKPWLLGEHAMLALRFAEATESLPAAWDELTLWERPIHLETAKIWRNGKAYWIAVAVTMMIISLYIASSIVPLLKGLVREFEFENYELSFLILHLDWFIYFGIGGAVLFAMTWIVWRFATWNPKSWLSRFTARISGEYVRQETSIWRLIAMNLASNASAKSSINLLARLHEDDRMQRKLNVATNSIAKGTDAWQSLVNAELLNPAERDAIAATSFPEVQAWTLRHLALRRREHLQFDSLRRNAWTQPIANLIFGSFVLVIAFAVFAMLTQMVYVLAERHG